VKLISRSRNGRHEHSQLLTREEASRIDCIPIGRIVTEPLPVPDFAELINRPAPIVVFWDGMVYTLGEGHYRYRAERLVIDPDETILCDVRPGGFMEAIRHSSALRLSQVYADMLRSVMVLRAAKKTEKWKSGKMGLALGIVPQLVELLVAVAREVE